MNYILKLKLISEKEKNDEIMANMIEEAERQLVISSDRIRDDVSFLLFFRTGKREVNCLFLII